jgi:hypothetical protein
LTRNNRLKSLFVLQEAFDYLVDAFKSGTCATQTDFGMIKFSSQEMAKELCDLDRDQMYLLTFLISNYVDKEGLVKKVMKRVSIIMHYSHTYLVKLSYELFIFKL